MDSKLFSKFLIKALRDLQFFLNLQNKIQLTIFTKLHGENQKTCCPNAIGYDVLY